MPIVYHPKLRDAHLKHYITLPCIKTAVLLLAILFVNLPLFAQFLFKVKIPGTAFSATSPGKKVKIEDFGGGRRFRGQAFAKVILSAQLRMPPASAADPRMQRLVIRFSTSASGPSLRTVELRNGAGVSFHIDTHLAGNYTTREVTKPESLANTWVWNVPERVSATMVLRMEIIFPGGFDSEIDPGEFVLNSVELGFPAKLATSSGTQVKNTAPLSATAGGQPGGSTATPPTPSAVANGVIYVLSEDNNLVWYSHTGRGNGSFN